MSLQQAQRLVRAVGRAFYTDDYIVVLDALCRRRYLMDNQTTNSSKGELGKMFNLPVRQVRKILSELYSHGLVHQEMLPIYIMHEDGKRKIPVRRVFWYINYRHFVYLVRLRVWMMKAESTKSSAPIDPFICNHCTHTYSDIDAQRNIDPEMLKFVCENCSKYGLRNFLVEQDIGENANAKQSSENENTLEEQLSKSLGLGREGIDDLLTALKVLVVPDNRPGQYLKGENDEKLVVDDNGEARGQKVEKDQNIVSIDDSQNQFRLQQQKDKDGDAEMADAPAALPEWMQTDATGGRASVAMEDTLDREKKKISAATAPDKLVKVVELGGAIDMWKFRKELEQANLKKRPKKKENKWSIPGLDNGGESSEEEQENADIEEDDENLLIPVYVQGREILLKDVTEDDTDLMTDEEYEQYANILRNDLT